MSVADINFSELADNAVPTTDPIEPLYDGPPIDPVEDPDKRNAVKEWLIGNGNAKPRPTRERKPKAPKPELPKIRANSHPFKKPLTDLYTSVGTLMMPFDQPCGMAIVMNAEKCAIALEDVARENEAVRRALTALITTSVWGAVLAAHAPILLAISMHHVPAVRNALTGINLPSFATPTESVETVSEES